MKNILGLYVIIINVMGFISMYSDKKKAIKNKWRISENYLLLIAILGGSIGSYIGMKKFRHKTKHIKFTFGIPFIIFIQIMILFII